MECIRCKNYGRCWPTHLCRICKSLYSSSRITTPAKVSTRTGTRTSKLQDFSAGPGELQVLGGCGVWRGPSIPRLGLMIDWARKGWSVSCGICCELGSTGWGGIWREVRLVTCRPNGIAAIFLSSDEDWSYWGVSGCYFPIVSAQKQEQVSLKEQLQYVWWPAI